MTKKIWCLFIAALLFSACSGGEDNGNPMEAMLAARPVDATETPTDDDVSSTEDDDVTEQSPLAVPQMGASDDDMMAPVATLEPEVTVPAPTEEPTEEPGDEPESLSEGGAGGEATVEEADEPEPTAPIGGEGGAGGNPVVEPESTPQPEPTVTVEPEPTVIVEPEPAVVVEPEPAAQPEPQPTVEPEPTVVVEPEPIVEPAPQPEPVAQPEPTVVVEPEPIAEPVPQPEPAPEPIVEPAPEPAPEPVAEPEPAPEPEAPVCVPSPKPPVSGSVEALECDPYEFTGFSPEEYAVQRWECLPTGECFASAMAEPGHKRFGIVRIDLATGSKTAEPSAVDGKHIYEVLMISGDSQALWAAGQWDGDCAVESCLQQPVLMRRNSSGSWVMDMTGIPTAQSGSCHAVWSHHGETFAVCSRGDGNGNGTMGVFRRLNSTWSEVPMAPGITGSVNAIWGSSATDVYFGGTNEGNTGSHLQRWDGCSLSQVTSLPSDMGSITDVKGINGEVVVTGYLSGTQNGTVMATDDLVSWTRADLPEQHAAFVYAPIARGAGVVAGTYRVPNGGPVAFTVTRSSGALGTVEFVSEALEVRDITVSGNSVVSFTESGLVARTCQ